MFAVCAAVFAAFLSSSIHGQIAAPGTSGRAPEPTWRVVRVVDGDTVVLAGPDKPVTVRLIGVDTPETVHPNKPVERFGREASAFLKTLIGGKLVRVEYEPGPSRLDKYGRTLAYLYLEPGGLFVNREIIARGYGHAYTKYPFAFQDDFRAAERAARDGRRGLWGPEPTAGNRTEEGTVFITRTGTKYHRAGCRHLNADATALPLERVALRYMPCSVCRPPVAGPESRRPGDVSMAAGALAEP
jgi:micrococcal nuclease